MIAKDVRGQATLFLHDLLPGGAGIRSGEVDLGA